MMIMMMIMMMMMMTMMMVVMLMVMTTMTKVKMMLITMAWNLVNFINNVSYISNKRVLHENTYTEIGRFPD